VQRLLLDLAALVLPSSIAPSTPPRSLIALELLQHGLFDEVGQLVDDEAALQRVLVLRETPARG
jgi:hypothetical protein